MQNMSFAFMEARFWKYVEGMTISPPFSKAKKDDNKDGIEKIYTWEVRIIKFQDNVCKKIAKIRKMCTNTVQNFFFQLRPKANRPLKTFGIIWRPDIYNKSESPNKSHLENFTKFGIWTVRTTKTL